jgi:hypothetical protein
MQGEKKGEVRIDNNKDSYICQIISFCFFFSEWQAEDVSCLLQTHIGKKMWQDCASGLPRLCMHVLHLRSAIVLTKENVQINALIAWIRKCLQHLSVM